MKRKAAIALFFLMIGLLVAATIFRPKFSNMGNWIRQSYREFAVESMTSKIAENGFCSAALPGWVFGKSTSWTMVGLPHDSHNVAILNNENVFGPKNLYGISFALWDDESKQFIFSKDAGLVFSLEDGYLPIPVARWRHGGILIEQKYFSHPDPKRKIAYCRIEIKNESDIDRRAVFAAVFHPFSPVPNEFSSVGRIKFDIAQRKISVNDSAVFMKPINDFMIFDFASDAGETTPINEREKKSSIADSLLRRATLGGMALAGLYLAPGKTDEIVLAVRTDFAGQGAEEDAVDFAAEAITQNKREWMDKLSGIKWLPRDEKLRDIVRVKAAYLLMNMDEERIHPGPTCYNNWWARDAYYMELALLRLGFLDDAKKVALYYLKTQDKSGEILPIVPKEKKWWRSFIKPNHEWDSQGQAIMAQTDYFRYSGDIEYLYSAYPMIKKSADFLIRLLDDSKRVGKDDPAFGILPPSWAAEDIGPETDRHYWDDWFAIAGFREAAFSAEILGYRDDAMLFRNRQAELTRDVFSSIATVMKLKGIDYIPNGPEDIHPSRSARGTSAGLWPTFVLDPSSPLVKRSLDVYYEQCVRPSGGGFVHNGDIVNGKYSGGTFWPFAGLDMAYDFLLAGRGDRTNEVFEWTLAHENFPGVFAWGENIDRETFRVHDGDMPNGWFASSFINLLHKLEAIGDPIIPKIIR